MQPSKKEQWEAWGLVGPTYWPWTSQDSFVDHDGYSISSEGFLPAVVDIAEYIMRNAGLEETQAGIKIAGRNINNLRYADALQVLIL